MSSTTSRSAKPTQFQEYFGWREIGLFTFVYIGSISNGYVLAVALLVLLIWSLTGASQALIALSISAVIRFTHPALGASAPFEAVLFWLIAMSAAASLYFRARRFSPAFFVLLAFAVIAVLNSTIVSPNVDVSVMKAVSFFVLSSAMTLAAGALKPNEVAQLQRWFFSLAISVAALSLLVVPFPAIAFQVGSGLQGVFAHPQLLGIFFAPFAAYFIVRIFLEHLNELSPAVIGAAVLFSGLIIAAGARTAMLATFLAVAVSLVIVFVKDMGFRQTRNRSQIIGFTFLMTLLALVVILFGGLKGEVEAIVLKGDDEMSVEEAFQASRGATASAQIQNFMDAPLTGHGFGIYRGGVLGGESNIKRFMGIPFSASAEKGVAFTAVLEEVGLFGAAAFYVLLVVMVMTAAKSRDPGIIAMALAAILVNLGESIIFSIGGMGLFMWLVLGFTLSKARVPWSRNSLEAENRLPQRRKPIVKLMTNKIGINGETPRKIR